MNEKGVSSVVLCIHDMHEALDLIPRYPPSPNHRYPSSKTRKRYNFSEFEETKHIFKVISSSKPKNAVILSRNQIRLTKTQSFSCANFSIDYFASIYKRN